MWPLLLLKSLGVAASAKSSGVYQLLSRFVVYLLGRNSSGISYVVMLNCVVTRKSPAVVVRLMFVTRVVISL